MAKKNEIQILDILRKTPGRGIQELASSTQQSPEEVFTILNDPDFKGYLKQTESAHLSQLRQLHRVAMEKICETLAAEDPKKSVELAKWVLKYSTESLNKVSELNAGTPGEEGGSNITINQMLGRDPFKA